MKNIGRDNNYRTGRQRTVVHEALPYQAEVYFVNKFRNFIKSAAMPLSFKTHLKYALIFLSTEKFMAQLGPIIADRWQNWVSLEIMEIWVSEIFYDRMQPFCNK